MVLEFWRWQYQHFANLEHTFTEPGVYIVSLTVLNSDGCTDTSIDSITITGMLTNVEETKLSDDQIHIFPVPAKDQLTIQFDFPQARQIKIRMIDLLGREVLTNEMKPYFRDTEYLNLNGLDDGIFFLIFESNGQRLVKKVVKSRI